MAKIAALMTPGGSTYTLKGRDIILDHVLAPDSMRNITAGRLVFGGPDHGPGVLFAPAMADLALSPEALRTIADLIECQEAG